MLQTKKDLKNIIIRQTVETKLFVFFEGGECSLDPGKYANGVLKYKKTPIINS